MSRCWRKEDGQGEEEDKEEEKEAKVVKDEHMTHAVSSSPKLERNRVILRVVHSAVTLGSRKFDRCNR